MTPTRPYLLRAIYEWLLDNNFTPYLLVDAKQENTQVPTEFIQENGTIVLNMSPTAVQNLDLDNEHVSFTARFSGQVQHIYVPMAAALGLYSRENGQGMMFQTESFEDKEAVTNIKIIVETPKKATKPAKDKKKRPSFLKVVK